MSIMDMFRVNEIKAELARTAKERDSLKTALSDTDKMEYHQLKQAIENLWVLKKKKQIKDSSGTGRVCETQAKI